MSIALFPIIVLTIINIITASVTIVVIIFLFFLSSPLLFTSEFIVAVSARIPYT